MKKKKLTNIAIIFCLIGLCAYFCTRKFTISNKEKVNMDKLQALTSVPIGLVASDTVLLMADVPTCYLGIAIQHAIPQNSLLTLWVDQDSKNAEAVHMIIFFDSMGVHMVNTALVKKDDRLFEVMVSHVFDTFADRLPEWKHLKRSDILISSTNVALSAEHPHETATINTEEKIDSVILRGYRILREETPRKMVYYEVVGRAVPISDDIERELGNKNVITETLQSKYYDSSQLNVERCYALRVPLEFYSSLMGLSGAGVYKFANGKATDELIGIQSNRVGIAEGEKENGRVTKMNKLDYAWIIFQRIYDKDLQ